MHACVASTTSWEKAVEFTWNELLSLLGPILLEGATDNGLTGKLNEAFRNRARDERNVKASNVNIRNEDLQKVKLQLRALGIVTRSLNGLWQLTTYGDKLLMRNAAIRSQREA
jgi:hypothetical protein